MISETPAVSTSKNSPTFTTSSMRTSVSSSTQIIRPCRPDRPSLKSSHSSSWVFADSSQPPARYWNVKESTLSSSVHCREGVSSSVQSVPSSSSQVISTSTRHSFGVVMMMYSSESSHGMPNGGSAFTITLVSYSPSAHTSITPDSWAVVLSPGSRSLSSTRSIRSLISVPPWLSPLITRRIKISRSNSVTVIGRSCTFSIVYVYSISSKHFWSSQLSNCRLPYKSLRKISVVSIIKV
mmetsp:Transcript_23654/g.35914  ORF Transcript_23654/g.35914 Transcript_23654/m.35914 type:complete len:238 (+) Transcript_23654:503-1216(+)